LLLTIYHKVGGLKTQKFIFSQFWTPEFQNQVISGATVPPEPLGGMLPFGFELLLAPGVSGF